MLKKGFITSMDAFRQYNITRLSGVIYKLKKEGFDVIAEYVPFTNEEGNSARYAKYSLKGKEKT